MDHSTNLTSLRENFLHFAFLPDYLSRRVSIQFPVQSRRDTVRAWYCELIISCICQNSNFDFHRSWNFVIVRKRKISLFFSSRNCLHCPWNFSNGYLMYTSPFRSDLRRNFRTEVSSIRLIVTVQHESWRIGQRNLAYCTRTSIPLQTRSLLIQL